MASKTKAEGAENQTGGAQVSALSCAVCLERYRRPKLLPCFHTFCERCVEKVAATRPSFPCPTCRSLTVMPPGGARELQANLYVEQDLAQAVSGGEWPDCELCGGEGASRHRCVDCQQCYCPSCRLTHHAIPACSSHSLLALGAEGGGVGGVGGQGPVAKNCPKHRGQALTLWCRPCEVSLCFQCKLTAHDGHRTEDAEDSGQRGRAELREEVHQLAQRQQSLQALLAKGDDLKAELSQEQTTVAAEIRGRWQQVVDMASQQRDKSLDGLEKTASVAMAALQEQLGAVQDSQEAVKARREHYDTVLQAQPGGGEGQERALRHGAAGTGPQPAAGLVGSDQG